MAVTIAGPNGKAIDTQMTMLLPERILSHMIENCGFTIEDYLVERYWNHLDHVGDEWAASTANFRRSVGSAVWPCGFYGDEAAIGLVNNPGNKVYGFFMNLPLYRPTATRLSRYLLFSIESDNILTVEQTIYPVLEKLTESFNRMTEIGVSGRRFLVSELRGDQAFFRYIFRHRSWWIANKICFRCCACSDVQRLVYTTCEGDWCDTYRSTEEFCLEELPNPPCPLVQLYFFNIDLIKHCTLHILNLGLLGVSSGSVLQLG